MVSSVPRHQILAAATAVFAETGFAGARVDEIADRAGVNKAMLYYHVGNKRALYEEVLRSVIAHVRSVLDRVVASSDDPTERLQRIAREIASFADSNPDLPAILFREVATGGRNLDDELLRELSQVFAKIRRIYELGAESGAFRPTDPLLAHLIFVGSLFFLIGSKPLRGRLRALMGTAAETEETPDALAAHFTELLLEGLRVRKGEWS
ncbi:MAG TPA: TetR/AcrR family transcriptional regulator [Thermoanaerobaculia bacterium]